MGIHVEENENYSDPNVIRAHTHLLKNISKLDKNPARVNKPVKSEPTLEISEFHLNKGTSSGKDSIKVTELVKKLTGNLCGYKPTKIINTAKYSHVIPKPAEKVIADKLKRQIGFQNTQNEFEKWSGIISNNRISENLVFPMQQTVIKQDATVEFIERCKVKSELEKEIEMLEPEKFVESKDTANEFPLTLEEMLEKTREAAKLRAQQSYAAAKNYKQKKVKSKTFHKYMKRKQLKQQLKDFEELQKTDPTAALAKLEQLDRARALERMSLKHKNTGTWAKNKQIRAKHDKKSRQELAQQLSIGRSLTEKRYSDDNSDSEDEDIAKPIQTTSEANPWTNDKTEESIDEFISKCRKYYDENNKSSRILKSDNTTNVKKINNESNTDTLHSFSSNSIKIMKNDETYKNTKNDELVKNKIKSTPKLISNRKLKITDEHVGTTKWSVEPVTIDNTHKSSVISIDALFDTVQNKVNAKKNRKKRKRNNLQKKEKINAPIDIQDIENEQPVMNEKRINFEVNESFNEVTVDNDIDEEDERPILKSNEVQSTFNKKSQVEIDPKNYINTKPKSVSVDFTENKKDDENEIFNDNNSDDEENDQAGIISEAFADDDVVDEFAKEKQSKTEQSQTKNLNESFPGWGSWAGVNIKTIKSKKSRFIVKSPMTLKPKNNNENIIINENDENKLKTHQVGDIPHPFNSIAEFEASIRAPCGRNFVPENAHRRLIQPSVVTKLGRVIDPMDHEVLLKRKKI